MKKIIIVESPAKAKTIESYMGQDYKVVASYGHIRDLATSGKGGLGIDIPSGFIPRYVILKEKVQLVNELKHACNNNEVFLATDPDREGEAISWHLANVLDLDINTTKRIEFNEITKEAIHQAFKNPRHIDTDLVSSQETRRMLDRIIGFQLSSLLQRKIKSKSAGRVQSSVLKIICDLEEEIEKFIPVPYYNIIAHFTDFNLDYCDEKGEKKRFNKLEDAQSIVFQLNNKFSVYDIVAKKIFQESKPPFITSTLQQQASILYNYSADRTLRIAQSLYEGKKIGNEQVGLITYMRTDSTRLSDEFSKDALLHIKKKYGDNYVGKVKNKTSKNAQDAHEAIRPTSINRSPDMIKEYLTAEEDKIYRLIYNHTLASLMSAAQFMHTTVIFDNNTHHFKIAGKQLIFDGYLKLSKLSEDDENQIIPEFIKGRDYTTSDIEIKESFTKPKTRFTEASLIKEMEELGIGRPSTYAQTIKTLLERKYIEIKERKIHPTLQGSLTSEKLEEFFLKIINPKYTANMETILDEIAKGDEKSVLQLQKFYDEFYPLYQIANEQMQGIPDEQTGEECPNCHSPLVVKKGKYGDFIACSDYPNCKYIKKEVVEVEEGILCPKCHVGHINLKKSVKGKTENSFYACSNYPKCKTIYNYEPVSEYCPICGEVMLKTPTGLKCSNANCNRKEDDENQVLCPVCKKGHFVKRFASKGRNKGKSFYACSNFPKCKIIYNFEPTNEKCGACGDIILTDGNLKSCANSQCAKHIKL